jgi:hypothetical protein
VISALRRWRQEDPEFEASKTPSQKKKITIILKILETPKTVKKLLHQNPGSREA